MKPYYTYSVLENDLRQAICSGKICSGQKIPTENLLARQYMISRNSVRKGIASLVREGLLRKVRGSGTFVIPLAERLAGMGKTGTTRKKRTILYLSFSSLYPRETFITKVRLNELFNSLSGVFPSHEYTIRFAHVGLDWKVPECLKKKSVSGVIFDGVVPEEFFNFCLRGIPSVGINGFDRSFDCSWVLEDFAGEKELEVQYLYERGFRKIALLSDESDTPPAQEGLKGYKYALEKYGLPCRKEWILYWKRSRQNGELQAENIYRPPDYLPYLRSVFEADDPPEAVICFDQWRAVNTVEALSRLNLRVPEDVSILCRINPHYHLDLGSGIKNFTGFYCRKEEVFLEAARILFSELNTSSLIRNKTVYLHPQFIPGESAANKTDFKKEETR